MLRNKYFKTAAFGAFDYNSTCTNYKVTGESCINDSTTQKVFVEKTKR